MEITADLIKSLRDQTGISVMQCRQALIEAQGDREKALIILQRRRSEAADKKSEREVTAGVVGVYRHNTNDVAAMVKLGCETDFVAKNQEFVTLANDIALHIVAMSPKYLDRDDVPEETIEKAKEVFLAEVANKPADLQEKIIEGKLKSYFKEKILLEQQFVKQSDITIADMVNGAVQKFGENIRIIEFARLALR